MVLLHYINLQLLSTFIHAIQVTALGHSHVEPGRNLMMFLEYVMTPKLYILLKEMVKR